MSSCPCTAPLRLDSLNSIGRIAAKSMSDYNIRWHRACADDEEEMQSEQQQLTVRPADMSFEQAMRHYMDEIAHTSKDTNSQLQTLDNRQGFIPVCLAASSLKLQSSKVCCLSGCACHGRHLCSAWWRQHVALTAHVGHRDQELPWLHCRIQEMTEDIAALRNALVPSRQAKRQRQSQSWFQSSYSWYIGGTAIAAVSYACLVYYRSQRSTGGGQLI